MTHCATVHRSSTAQQAGGTWGNKVCTMATFFLKSTIDFNIFTFFTLLKPFCSAVYRISQNQTVLKFICSEKATKFCKIFPLLLIVCTVAKSKGKISQNFVAFSEYINFTKLTLQ